MADEEDIRDAIERGRILERVDNLTREVTLVQGKLDQILQSISTAAQKQGERIGVIEKNDAHFRGAAKVIGVLLGIVQVIVTGWIIKHL